MCTFPRGSTPRAPCPAPATLLGAEPTSCRLIRVSSVCRLCVHTMRTSAHGSPLSVTLCVSFSVSLSICVSVSLSPSRSHAHTLTEAHAHTRSHSCRSRTVPHAPLQTHAPGPGSSAPDLTPVCRVGVSATPRGIPAKSPGTAAGRENAEGMGLGEEMRPRGCRGSPHPAHLEERSDPRNPWLGAPEISCTVGERMLGSEPQDLTLRLHGVRAEAITSSEVLGWTNFHIRRGNGATDTHTPRDSVLRSCHNPTARRPCRTRLEPDRPHPGLRSLQGDPELPPQNSHFGLWIGSSLWHLRMDTYGGGVRPPFHLKVA